MSADPRPSTPWGDRTWRRRRIASEVVRTALFPELPLEGTPWLPLWREQEDRTVLVTSRVVLVLTAAGVLAHWFFVDRALGMSSPRWVAYRFGSAGFYFLLLGLTFAPPFRRTPLVRLPLLLLALALGALQAKAVQWSPAIVYIWAFALTVPPLVFLRMSSLTTLAALVACFGVQWLVAWRNTHVPITNLVSWGTVSGILAVASRARMALDVRSFLSERRELDAQKRLIEMQIELDRVKTSFFTNVSHELRTPLTLILAPLETMLAGARAVPREFRGQLELMHRNAERLLRHVNALLHLSRLDAKREYLHLEEVDPAELLRTLVADGQALAEKRHLQLRFEAEAPVPRILLDREKVEQIALNLLGNALRFTDGSEHRPGHVTVRCGLQGALLGFEVEDDGVGIPANELPHVFDRFHQVPGHAARGGGTGIGLALVKELTDFHMGRVTVRSRLGAGSVFRVELPVDASVYPPERLDRRQQTAVAPAVERRRPITRPRLELVSSTEPLPSEAPPVTPERPTPRPPAERASTERAPAMPRPAGERPTPVPRPAGERTTPVPRPAGERTTPLPRPPEPAAAPRLALLGDRPLVLLVDDNRELLDFLSRQLEPEFRCVTAEDAPQARKLATAEVPALVVSDVMMPGGSGTDLLRALRADPHTRHVPVIFVTARTDVASRVDSLEQGADDYVAKPFDLLELRARIRSLLARRRLERELSDKNEYLAKVNFDLVLSKRQVFLETLEAFALAVEAKDPYTHGHSRRVALLAERISRELALSDKDRETVRIAGILHDVGKIGTPEAVLLKPGRLEPHEYEIFKRHAALGHRIVSAVKDLDAVGQAILHHHERFDGGGYPAGLAGQAIPVLSRILAACDTYDAMTSDRPYRASLGHRAAVEELARCAGRQLDPEVVRAFLRLYEADAPTYPEFPSGLRELAGAAGPRAEP